MNTIRNECTVPDIPQKHPNIKKCNQNNTRKLIERILEGNQGEARAADIFQFLGQRRLPAANGTGHPPAYRAYDMGGVGGSVPHFINPYPIFVKK